MFLPFFGVSQKELLFAAKHLSLMLKAGIPLVEALDVVGRASRGFLQKTFFEVKAKTEGGEKLSDALAASPRVFAPLFRSLVAVGESSGTLTENLDHIVRYLEREQALASRIRGAMLYPLVVVTVFFGVFVVVATFVLPRVTQVFRVLHADLPPMTRAVIAVANFFEAHGQWVVPASAVALFLVFLLARHPFSYPVVHRLLLTLPVIGGLVRHVALTRFSRSLGILLAAGIPLQEAVPISAKTAGNVVYQKHIEALQASVIRGQGLAHGLLAAPSVFPEFVGRMIAVGEKSGKLEEALSYIATFYEDEVDTASQNLTTLLEPLLLVVIAVLVGAFALAIITPIYEVVGHIRR